MILDSLNLRPEKHQAARVRCTSWLRSFLCTKIVLLLLLMGPAPILSFTHTHGFLDKGSSLIRWRRLPPSHSKNYLGDTTSDPPIREQIIQLSRIADDKERRSELRTRLENSSRSFTMQFNDELIRVGTQYQTDALERAANNQDPQQQQADQKQLWALVDMMVQTKVFIKENKSENFQ